MDENFKVILQAILDNSGIPSDIDKIQKIAEKTPINLKAKLASTLSKQELQEVSSELLKIINKEWSLNLNTDDVSAALKKCATQEKELEKQTQSVINKFQKLKDTGKLNLNFTKAQTEFNKINNASDELKADFQELQALYSTISSSSSIENDLSSFTAFETKLAKVMNGISQYKLTAEKVKSPLSEIDKITFAEQLRAWKRINSAAKGSHAQIDDLLTRLENTTSVEELAELRKELKLIDAAASAAGTKGKSLVDTFKTAAQKFTEWLTPSTIIMKVAEKLQQMVENVKELDNSLLELSKVTDLSATGLEKVSEEAFALGRTVAKTGTQTLDAITSAKRAGYDLSEAMNLAEDALKMTNVSEGIDDAGTAMENLIHIIKGFEEDSSFSKTVNDVINEVDKLAS